MANNKRIKFLRGDNITTDNTKKTTELLAGQPVYDTTKHILRVGSGKQNENTIENTKPLNVEGNAILGTTNSSDVDKDRQPDHIFEKNSNTVKNASQSISAKFVITDKNNQQQNSINKIQLFSSTPEDRLTWDYDLDTFQNRIFWTKDLLAHKQSSRPEGVRSENLKSRIVVDLSAVEVELDDGSAFNKFSYYFSYSSFSANTDSGMWYSSTSPLFINLTTSQAQLGLVYSDYEDGTTGWELVRIETKKDYSNNAWSILFTLIGGKEFSNTSKIEIFNINRVYI